MVQGKNKTPNLHGAALGPEIIKELRENLQWPHPEFFIPKNIYSEWDATERGKALELEWEALKDKFKDSAPEKYDLLQRLMVDRLPETFDHDFNSFVSKLAEKTDDIATRKASQIILEELTNKLPELIGGSADLSGSNNTNTSKSISITDDPSGNYIFYGVREFGMNAIVNGISLHGGLIPYAGTFLVFMDYGRNAVRMSSLMGIRTIFVFSHDSIALGEDGPTHQPIEHLSTLRATPNMSTWRPANLTETAAAWLNALKNENSPTSIILSRQNLRHFVTTNFEDACSGGYFVKKMPNAKINLIATGSEVTVALDASEILKKEGIEVNIASVPCIEALEKNKKRYDSIFDNDISIAIECSHPSSWYKHTKRVIGIDAYGESGAGNDLLSHFGFTAAKIAQRIKRIFMRELKDVVLVGKHVGLRVDLNVPIEDGAVMNDERLSATLPTILEILKSTKNLTIISHLGRPKEGEYSEELSLKPIVHWFEKRLNLEIPLVKSLDELPNGISFLENIRMFPGESRNDDLLSELLSKKV